MKACGRHMNLCVPGSTPEDCPLPQPASPSARCFPSLRHTQKPISAVYFADAGQEVVVSAGQARAGAPELAYVAATPFTKDVPNGTFTDVGCMRNENTDRAEQWLRPDGTTFSNVVGTGTALAAVDVCSTLYQTRTVVQPYTAGSPCDGTFNDQHTYYQARTTRKNAGNNYSTSTAWAVTGANYGSVGSCPGQTGFYLDTKICTVTSGGTQAEICAAGTF